MNGLFEYRRNLQEALSFEVQPCVALWHSLSNNYKAFRMAWTAVLKVLGFGWTSVLQRCRSFKIQPSLSQRNEIAAFAASDFTPSHDSHNSQDIPTNAFIVSSSLMIWLPLKSFITGARAPSLFYNTLGCRKGKE